MMTAVSCYGREIACGFEKGPGQVIYRKQLQRRSCSRSAALCTVRWKSELSDVVTENVSVKNASKPKFELDSKVRYSQGLQ